MVRLIKFSAVGGVGTLLNLSLILIMTEIVGLMYLASALFSFIIVLVFQYLFNNYWTFRMSKGFGHFSGLSKFSVVTVVETSLYFGLLALFVQIFGLHYLLSASLAIGIRFPVKYLMCRNWVWSSRKTLENY